MTARDMRDMLGLTGDVARPPPAKKRKTMEKRPLEKGMAREVTALMGERAPPVSMIPVQPRYKQRPRRTQKVVPWDFVPFKNPARADDLVLHHWQRKHSEKPALTKASTDAGAETEDRSEVQDGEGKPEEDAVDKKGRDGEEANNKAADYRFAKYDVQIDVPTYTAEIYNAQLNDEDWTKEETDYLISLVKDFAQKWPVIVDRYEYQPPSSEEGQLPPEPKTRSMEDLKARYYTVTAKMLARETPISSMNSQQYSFYQTLTNFDAMQESSRKKLTEQHLHRTELEVQEETALLAELQRIMINQTSLESERAEIRERLDYPLATTTNGMQYTTSAALGQLFQQLLAADRLKKDRRLKEQPNTAGSGGSTQPNHRDSLASATGTGPKRPGRESLASASGAGPRDDTEPRSRALSPHSAARYFVTTHDRLSAGVSFASDKLSKPRVAKSTVQTERIGAVLQFLKIPDLIPLPTQRVVDEFERLMARVNGLLELRKVAEREEGELKVRLAERGIREEGKKGVKVEEEAGKNGNSTNGAGAGEGEGDEATRESRGQKRSASVLSAASQQSSKRPKSRHAA